ncbi:hypothetical protein N7486_006970 [Penicillium sp. IBT 16267x]|nr:hypothetical protein N7486_006970 [Penicillium sp. IBT 16267x]
MSIKETISSPKIPLPERAYFIGRRQSKITEDLETGDLKAQSPKIVSDDRTEHRWPEWCTRKLFFQLSVALAVIILVVYLALAAQGLLPRSWT